MKKKKKWNTLENDGQFRSIKVPLKSIIREEQNVQIFNNCAIEINKLVTLGYQLVRLFLLSKHKEDSLPEVNEQLYETALSIILNPNKKPRKTKSGVIQNKIKAELSTFYTKQFLPLISQENLPKLTNVSTTIQKLRQEMYTSFINNIVTHYYSRLSRALGVLLEMNDEYLAKKKNKRKETHSKLLKDVLKNTITLPEFKEIVAETRKYLPDLGESSLAINLLRKPSEFIKPTFQIADLLEKRGVRLFQAVPLRKSDIPKHFPVNSTTLVNLVDCTEIVGTNRIKNVSELSKSIGKDERLKWILWNHYFKLDKKVFDQKGFNFCYSIDTDGFSCTLKFIKEGCDYEKYEKKKRKIVWSAPSISELPEEMKEEILSKCKVVGGDPGKEILLQLIDGDGITLRYTVGQRYTESRYYKYRRIRHDLRFKNDIFKLEEPLSNYKSKSMDLEKFKEYIKAKAEVSLKVSLHYCSLIYRKLQFRSQIYSKNSINKFLDQIEKTYGEDTIIAYGNWSRSTQMRGIVPTPGIGLKRKCAERFGVYEIDEYGTSKYCSHCGKEVKNFYYKRRKVHRVLICKECSGPQDVSKVRFMHRDINGSKNIRELGRCELSNLPRPVPFCRKKRLQCTVPGAGTEKKELNLVKKVPKIIKKIKAVGRKAELTKEMV